MQKKNWLGRGILTACLCALPIAATVSAVSLSAAPTQDQALVITTDKSEYSGSEKINATVTVKNTTDSYLLDIVVGGVAPDGYEVSGKASDSEWSQEIHKLSLQSSESVKVTFSKKDTAGGSTNTEEDPGTETPGGTQTNPGDGTQGGAQTNPNGDTEADDKNSGNAAPTTGDNSRLLLYIILCVLSEAGIIYLIKSGKIRKFFSIFMAITMASSLVTFGVTDTRAAEPSAADYTATADVKVDGKTVTIKAYIKSADKGLSYEAYNQVWADEFNGEELNTDDWNVEGHEPGWVNEELQRYPGPNDDFSKNIYLEEGNLVIKPIKTVNADGTTEYTSGRINTQGKHDFKYGIFEAKVKVPSGKGYLPAFWLMSSDENIYGQWPRCGEIDIMEVHGSATDKAYGTIHYGNPHRESQGSYVLDDGSYADEFHIFAVEWEPGSIKWYMDGELFHEENDWYSITEGLGEVAYPAPFDQPFYMILNLAVGGSWVGYPDETTDFANQAYEVDYVRVYQKDSYNEDVTKPDKEVVLRDPDSEGNYIVNGKFDTVESLTDDKDWKFMTALEGEAKASISGGVMNIETTNAGTVDYSVQLVQANVPFEKGATYRLSFDAKADAARTMRVDVKAPDYGYASYMPTMSVDLSDTFEAYVKEFKMTNASDANGRLEFNMGAAGSTAGITIDNVKLIKIAEPVDEEEKKTILSDGNYIYNSKFQEGEKHLGYWEIDNRNDASISVTDLSDGRRLKVTVDDNGSTGDKVTVGQSGLAISAGKEYALSFDAQADAVKQLKVKVAGQEYTANLGTDNKSYSFKLVTGSTLADEDRNISFELGMPGTVYLDNVRLVEDAMIKNGSFDAGTVGYEIYVNGAADASYVVDSLNEDNALDFTISKTGDQEWYIQLKQNDVTLEKDVWYTLSFDVKSSIARKIQYSIQRNGAVHKNADGSEDWTPYVQDSPELEEYGEEGAYTTIRKTFMMKETTDTGAIFNIALGGGSITDKHRVCIDNIVLNKATQEEIEAAKPEEVPTGNELITNGNFENGGEGWTEAVTSPGAATVDFSNGSAVYNITDVGTEDWNVQLKKENLTLESGKSYHVKLTITSTEARTVKLALLDPLERYRWYGGIDIVLEKNAPLVIDQIITIGEDLPTSATIDFVISMGKIGDATPVSTITIDDISIIKQN